MFEQFNVPYKSIMDAEIKAGSLETKFDTIILPADSIAASDEPRLVGLVGRVGEPGLPTTRRLSSAAALAPRASRHCSVCRKRRDAADVRKCRYLPIQRFELPLRNVVAGLAPKAAAVSVKLGQGKVVLIG